MGLSKYKDIEFIKLRLAAEKDMDLDGNSCIQQETIDKAKTMGNLDRLLLYAIDHNLKLDPEVYPAMDPVKYAIENPNLFSNKVKDIRVYALDGVIDQYIRTNDPNKHKVLEARYRAIHNIGRKDDLQLLTLDSDFGKFVSNESSPQILANASKFLNQKSHDISVDYTKCDLPLIAKCLKMNEKLQNTQSANYDNLSAKQKIIVALSAIIPPLSYYIYTALVDSNAKAKSQAEVLAKSTIEGLHADLQTIKPSTPQTQMHIQKNSHTTRRL